MTNVPQIVEKLLEAEGAATPGPWFDTPTPKDAGGWATSQGVAGVGGGKSGMIYAAPPGGTFPSADKELIIATRNHLRPLCEALKAALEENAHYRNRFGRILLSDATDAQLNKLKGSV